MAGGWRSPSAARWAVAVALMIGAGCAAISGVSDLEEVATCATCDAGAPEAGHDATADAGREASCADHPASDPANCGRCGHDCLGGGCSGGACLSVVLATGRNNPQGIAVDEANVYWADDVPDAGQIAEVPIDGGATTVLASNQDQPLGIQLRGPRLYFTSFQNATAIQWVPLDGGPPTSFITGTAASPRRLTMNSLALFHTNFFAGSVSIDPEGGNSTVIANNELEPAGIAADETALYWINHGNGMVRTGSFDGGSLATLATGTVGPLHIAIDAANVYWTNTGTGDVLTVAKTGGTSRPIAANEPSPGAIAVDAAKVYWLNGDGTLKAAPIGGGAAVTLATGQSKPAELALDAARLYWTNAGDGTVMRLAK